MPGMRGDGYHLSSVFFGAGVGSTALTVSVSQTLGGFVSTEGNNSYSSAILNAGVSLNLQGCPLYIADTLSFGNNSSIFCNGNDASAFTGGAASGSFKLWGGNAGATAPVAGINLGTAGANGTAIGCYNLGGSGGAGGLAGANAGGAAGVEYFGNGTQVGLKSQLIANFEPMYSRLFKSGAIGEDNVGTKFPLVQGMAGGASGGSGASNDAGSRGGGGGGGGGVIWIAADTIRFGTNVILACQGGAGGGASGVTAASGGGGGGGGCIVLFFHDMILPVANRPQLFCQGGTPGNPLAGGNVGLAGSSGKIILFNLGTGHVTTYTGSVTL